MVSLGEMSASEIKDSPWRLYRCHTGHGSELDVYWRCTHGLSKPEEMSDPIALVGEMCISGYAVSKGESINLAGLGWEPEVGGSLTVDSETSKELITKIEYVREVG